MADPFTILATIVTVVEVANVVTSRLSVVCQSTKSISCSLEETLESIQLLAASLSMIKDAMTARTDLAANLAFTLPFSRTVARCDRLLAQIKTEVDRLLSIPDWETKIYSKIKFRTKLSFAEKRLREYQESLHKLRDDLGFCMIAVQSHATMRCQHAQAGVSVVMPRIKDFNANFDFGAIHAYNDMMCFAAFMRDLGTDDRQPVDTSFEHTATAKMQRKWVNVYEALVTHVDYFQRLVLHLDQYADTPKPTQINSHVIFSIAAGKVVRWEQDSCDRRKRSPYLAPALMPASHKGERFVQNSSFQPHRLFPLVNGHFHQVYRILIDARSNAKPFETLVDALILHYIRDWSERFWKIVHDRFDKGDSFELSLEEKVQIVLWFWGYGFRTDCEWRCSWEIQVTILHSGPCFQSPWKADLHAFVSLCERIRFYALHFTYYYMRVDGDEGSETFRILESQQHAFAIIPQLDPEMHIGYYLLDFRAFSDRTTLQGPVGCWFPTCEPSLDVSQIDADRIGPGDAWMGSHCTGCFYQIETSQSMIWQLMAFRMRPVKKYARPPFVSCQCYSKQTSGTDLNEVQSTDLVQITQQIFKAEIDRSLSRPGFPQWVNCRLVHSLCWLGYDIAEPLYPKGRS